MMLVFVVIVSSAMIENSYLLMSPYERRRWVIIVLDNGLSPVQQQAIIYPIFSPLRSIPADGFIAWRNFCLSFRLSNLANKSGVATLSVTKNCSMGAIYLTWQGCFRRFLISGAELSKYDFFPQNIAILNTFSSSVNW